MEFVERLRLGYADLGEGLLVVDEPGDNGGHRNTEGGFTIVGLPRSLCDIGEIVHALDGVDAIELMFLIERERGVERTAGNKVAGSTAIEPRVEGGIVFLGRRGRELDLDVGIVLVEGRNDLGVPDIGVVIAPALDLQ